MKGDPGYFGPQSMMWKVNKEITVLFGGPKSVKKDFLYWKLIEVWKREKFRHSYKRFQFS